MANATPDKYLRNTALSGNVRQLSSNAGSAAVDTTTARYTAAGTTSGIRWNPIAVATAANAPPSVGTAAADMGWRNNVGYDAGAEFGITILSGTWTVRFRYLRGAPVGAIDQLARVTAILYRVSAAGTFISEIARGNVDVTFTTTAQTGTITIASVAAQSFALDDRIQLEVYVQTELTAGTFVAPIGNQDLLLRIGESEANSGSKVSAPGHNKKYARTFSTVSGNPAVAAGVTALTRHSTLHRTLAVAVPAVVTLSRRLTLARTMAVVGTGLTTIHKRVGKFMSVVVVGVTPRFLKTVGIRRSVTATALPTFRKAITKRMSVAVTGVATLVRRLTIRRAMAVTVTGVARAWAQLPFNKIPGGVATIVKRVINVWED